MTDILHDLLRPAGGGVVVFSTGTAEIAAQQKRIYRAVDAAEVDAKWRAAIERLPTAELVILAIPSDIGAGYRRGANLGPSGLRGELVRRGSFLYDDPRVVDLGDVRVIPQLLDDEMLSQAQITRSKLALYGDANSPLPVGPLTMAKLALDEVRRRAPHAVPLVLGGDHSVAWPVVESIAAGRAHQLGILHFDAHTDLLAERIGVRICFATWAYHANELIGRRQRLVQVGIRATRKTQAEWQDTLGVRQIWMDEIARRSVDELAEEIIATWDAAGVRGVYVSNDIDGTDVELGGAATGTPEPHGLHPATVTQLIDRICRQYPMWGSDLVEVAPPLGQAPSEPQLTLTTACDYIELQARRSLDWTSRNR